MICYFLTYWSCRRKNLSKLLLIWAETCMFQRCKVSCPFWFLTRVTAYIFNWWILLSMDRKNSPARKGLQGYEAYRSRSDISPLRAGTSTPTRSTAISPTRVKSQVSFDVPYKAKVNATLIKIELKNRKHAISPKKLALKCFWWIKMHEPSSKWFGFPMPSCAKYS